MVAVDPAQATAIANVKVRGSALWTRLEWVRENKGEKALHELLPELGPAGRNLIHAPVDRAAWYSYPLFLELSMAIDRHFGSGDNSLLVEIGRWGCHKNVPALYAVFIKLGSVDWVLGRASKLWREHFNTGSIEVHRELGQQRGFGELKDWPRPHLAHCNAVMGFSIGAIELSGEKHVRGTMMSCKALGAERCVSKIVWGDEPDPV